MDDPELVPELGVVVEDPEPVDDGDVVDEGEVVEEGDVVEDGDEPLVPGTHGDVLCPEAEPACGSLSIRPDVPALLRAVVPCCVVVPLEVVVLLLPVFDPV